MEDDSFTDNLQEFYHRWEPSMRKALSQFMIAKQPDYAKDKSFYLGFYNLAGMNSLRSLRSEHIGKLISIHGTVTRTTEVKPELQYGVFRCLECNHETDNVEQQYKFTEPVICKNS